MRSRLSAEFLGTFTLVLLGCGSIGSSILLGWPTSLPVVALIWGLAVTIGILLSMKRSGAHLNPAVSFAAMLAKDMTIKTMLLYWLAQLVGAFAAASAIYGFFLEDIGRWERTHDVIRGTMESQQVSMMFGEYFPNPGFADSVDIDLWGAVGVEALGTALLIGMISIAVRMLGTSHMFFAPTIGLTVSVLIISLAPYTQMGINPARDMGPRLFSYLAGWESAAWASGPLESILVYVIGPLAGATIATFVGNIFSRS